MDTEGFILNVNEAFSHLFGYQTEDLFGKHTRVLFTLEDQNRRLPEMEIERVNQMYSAVDRNYTLHKDGTCIWVSGESILVKDREGRRFITKFIQNIHEQKVLEKVLKESTEFSESVVKSMTDSIIVFDTDLRILKVNNAFYRLLEITQQTLEGLSVFEVEHKLLQSQEFLDHLKELVIKETSDDFKLECKIDGEQIKHLHFKASFIDGKLVNKRILLVVSDITDKVNAEQKRDDLIAFVIHELRNPLANIALCNTLIDEAVNDNDKGSASEYLRMSSKNTELLKSLIQELYDATKAGSGSLQFDKTVFVLEDLINEAVANVQITNSKFDVVRKGSANFEIRADRGRIGQVFSNYLVNAMKYSAGANKIEVDITLEGGSVTVAVKDFGKGIPPKEIPHLFERYFRAEKTSKIEGLGLGLYLSKQIIDAHNGRVWVTSKENEGSTFYFSLPLE